MTDPWRTLPLVPDQSPVKVGDHVVLTNPNYPDIRIEGIFLSGNRAGEPRLGTYGTYTVKNDDGTFRSEGVLHRGEPSHEEAKALVDAYFEAFPKLKDWSNRV